MRSPRVFLMTRKAPRRDLGLGLREYLRPRVTISAAQHQLAVARGRRKSGTTTEATDRRHLPLDGLAQVLQQMKAVCDLAGLRSALPDALGVKSAAVAAHDLDFWPPREPIRGLLGRAGLQDIGDGSAFQINDDRPIRKALAPAPVVDGDGPQSGRVGTLTKMAFQLTQDSVVADRHGEPRQQSFARQTSCSVSE